jgi:hypothetical protein
MFGLKKPDGYSNSKNMYIKRKDVLAIHKMYVWLNQDIC